MRKFRFTAGLGVEAMRDRDRTKLIPVFIPLTAEMKQMGGRIILDFDPEYESPLECAARVFLAMMEVQKGHARGQRSAPRKVGGGVSE